MNDTTLKTADPHDYDVDKETAASRKMLEKRIPSEINKIKIALVDIDKRKAYEPWHLALTVDLVDAIERNCEQILETIDKDRLAASAWLPEICSSCWCGSNTARFHGRMHGAFTKTL